MSLARSILSRLTLVYSRHRTASPLWEMVQEGIDINAIDWSQH